MLSKVAVEFTGTVLKFNHGLSPRLRLRQSLHDPSKLALPVKIYDPQERQWWKDDAVKHKVHSPAVLLFIVNRRGGQPAILWHVPRSDHSFC